jgi:hypothetical protein
MRGSQHDPFSRITGDQKIFGSLPCPKRVSQIMWLLASPKVAHGTGSKDSDNSIVLGGADYQSDLVVLPHPMQVHRSSHLVIIQRSSQA